MLTDVFFSLFALIIFFAPLIVIISVLKAAAKNSRNSRNGSNPNAWLQAQQMQQVQQNRNRTVKSLKSQMSGSYHGSTPQRSVGSKKGTSLLGTSGGSNLAETFMRDDRQHDWLARQRREEERILRRGDMMDLGASHAASCDADLLKRYHLYAEHDDTVDRGEY